MQCFSAVTVEPYFKAKECPNPTSPTVDNVKVSTGDILALELALSLNFNTATLGLEPFTPPTEVLFNSRIILSCFLKTNNCECLHFGVIHGDLRAYLTVL